MIKLTFLLRRKQSLSQAEFDLHWRTIHADLVKRHAQDLRIQRYVQSPALSDPAAQEGIRASRSAEAADYDGVAEIWWNSLEDLAEARRTPEGAAATKILFQDEERFIDHPSSRLWYAYERVVLA